PKTTLLSHKGFEGGIRSFYMSEEMNGSSRRLESTSSHSQALEIDSHVSISPGLTTAHNASPLEAASEPRTPHTALHANPSSFLLYDPAQSQSLSEAETPSTPEPASLHYSQVSQQSPASALPEPALALDGHDWLNRGNPHPPNLELFRE
ncbi:hypothetical protein HDU91_004981, partial [Kappamyces sp. JEL0680]